MLSEDAGNYQLPNPQALWRNGSFGVFKMMSQDVVGFENFLQSNKDRIDPELLAAKLLGRWRNGVPLSLSPDTDSPPGGVSADDFNNFEYVNSDGSGDPRGLRCPVGAHIRRCNPRGQPVAGQGHPGGSNNSHRLIRRGMPYGPKYDPSVPYEGIERGLLGFPECSAGGDRSHSGAIWQSAEGAASDPRTRKLRRFPVRSMNV